MQTMYVAEILRFAIDLIINPYVHWIILKDINPWWWPSDALELEQRWLRLTVEMKHKQSSAMWEHYASILELLYFYDLSHKHLSTVTVCEFIAAFVCGNQRNPLGKTAGGRDSGVFIAPRIIPISW